jgi:hypothetical protein
VKDPVNVPLETKQFGDATTVPDIEQAVSLVEKPDPETDTQNPGKPDEPEKPSNDRTIEAVAWTIGKAKPVRAKVTVSNRSAEETVGFICCPSLIPL